MSKRACVGCSPFPSPALMIGIFETSDAFLEGFIKSKNSDCQLEIVVGS